MQIVIDIDDEQVLFDIKNQGFEAESETDKVIIKALYNGIILPKHGRLIDSDVLIKRLEATANIEWNKKVGSSKGLEDAIDIVDDAPTIIEADITNKNKITYQPVDDCKECNFYKDGKEKDLSEKLDDYYLQPYRDNPFREGRMSGFWGEYEYYCPKCNLEITKVFYDNEHIRVGDCSKCPKCKESD